MILSDIKTYLRDRHGSDASAMFVRVAVQLANNANRALHKACNWPFDRRVAQMVLAAPYNTGTASITADATALTGTDTTWTSAMVGRYIRLDGQSKLYRITAFGSTTSLTIETYRGDTLSDVSYSIMDVRQAAPSRFRCTAWPLTDDLAYPKLTYTELQSIIMMHAHEKLESYPSHYSIEYEESSSIPSPYLWFYPTPSEERLLTIPYFVYPSALSDDADIVEIPADVEDVMYAFLDAELARYKGDPNWVTLQGTALQLAQTTLAHVDPVIDAGRRMEWSPELDPSDGAMQVNERHLDPNKGWLTT